MKRYLKTVLAIGLVALVVLVGATAVYAYGPGFGKRAGGRGLENLADALGVELEALRAALEEGKTIADLAEGVEGGIEGVQAAFKAARQAAIEQAVEDGKLTAEQAEI